MSHQTVIVVDLGGQYNQLIARKVREHNVYCKLVPYSRAAEEIEMTAPIGVIFTGGPNSVYAPNAPKVDDAVYDAGVPILGICYGAQLMAYALGGSVKSAPVREYGRRDIRYSDNSLFSGMDKESTCWMSHTDYVDILPEGFEIAASTDSCPAAAFADESRKLYAVQFHPEVAHCLQGSKIIENFLYKICNAAGDWTMGNFVRDQVCALKEKIGDKKVLCAFSGGVDSAVAATLVHRAAGDNLSCIFVDHGLLRYREADEVMRVFAGDMGMNVVKADASDDFISKLEGVRSPERKRKIIGAEFIKVFEREAKKIGKVDYLVQGTIYPDVIESGKDKSAVIKSHHNVGGLPDIVDFDEIIEPLRDLFKDEVRKVGYELGLPASVVERQPFPGPGLAIRIIGAVTRDKIDILQRADCIFRKELEDCGAAKDIWQYFAVLTNTKSVGVMGDKRTYEYTVALRAVTAVDGMTCDWAHIPYDVLSKVSSRIVNEVPRVNRIVYDITSKPPATIEWE